MTVRRAAGQSINGVPSRILTKFIVSGIDQSRFSPNSRLPCFTLHWGKRSITNITGSNCDEIRGNGDRLVPCPLIPDSEEDYPD